MNSEGVIQCQGQRQGCCPPGAAAAAAVVPLQPVIDLCPHSCWCDWQPVGWAPFNAPTGRSWQGQGRGRDGTKDDNHNIVISVDIDVRPTDQGGSGIVLNGKWDVHASFECNYLSLDDKEGGSGEDDGHGGGRQ